MLAGGSRFNFSPSPSSPRSEDAVQRFSVLSGSGFGGAAESGGESKRICGLPRRPERKIFPALPSRPAVLVCVQSCQGSAEPPQPAVPNGCKSTISGTFSRSCVGKPNPTRFLLTRLESFYLLRMKIRESLDLIAGHAPARHDPKGLFPAFDRQRVYVLTTPFADQSGPTLAPGTRLVECSLQPGCSIT
jgi:hypothetical protein